MRIFPRIEFKEKVKIIDNGKIINTTSVNISPIALKINYTKLISDEIIIELILQNKKFRLKAKVYRKENKDYVVLKFTENSERISESVGKYIESKVKNICPYCYSKNIKNGICNCCEMPLNFSDPKFIERLKRFKLSDAIKKDENVFPIEMDKEFLDENIRKLIKKYSQVDYPILITGETGSGKTYIAKLIHNLSKKQEPFIDVNCAAIPSDLLESELFGYVKGAFTGANKDKKGLIEEAEGGTLFLDEIGEMSFALQTKLLKFLDEGSYYKIGSTKKRKANIRIIAATNKNLRKSVKENKFREDLYFRINTLEIKLPSLRSNKEMIKNIIIYYLKKYLKENKKNINGFSDEALEVLYNYDWPGNIRELINVIKKSIVICDKNIIDVSCLDIKPPKEKKNIHKYLFEIEKDLVIKAFSESKGNISKMAKLLGVSRPTVYKLINKYNLGKLDN